MRLSMQQARQIIDAEENVSLGVKRSAKFLFDHEMKKRRPSTPRKALQRVLRWMAEQRAQSMAIYLTPAELRIVMLLVHGLTLKQISLEVGTSFRAVKKHMQNVRKKTGTLSTYQVIAVAVDRGWVQAPRVDD